MYSLNRMQRLADKLGVSLPVYSRPLTHQTLDTLDRHAGIITRHGKERIYHGCPSGLPCCEYVGARLTRLERHVFGGEAERPYFWLGEAA
jgi:hypothetical protein